MNDASVATSQEGPRPPEPGGGVRKRYVLVRRVGWDGTAPIYEAVDALLAPVGAEGPAVWLELLPEHLTRDPQRLEAFKAAFLRVRGLAHENVARIYDLDSDAGRWFLTMEPLDGASVAEILEESAAEPMSRAEALAIVRATGAALAHAHTNGIVHGRLEPRDVVVTEDYGVKVRGFLRVRDARSSPLAAERAPEPRDDVAALARLARALLANDAAVAEPSRVAASDAPGRPRGVGASQWRALARATAPEPERRPADIGALLQALEIEGTESLAAAVNADVPRRPRVRKRFWLAAALALAAAGLYTGRDRLTETVAPLAARWLGPAEQTGPVAPPAARRETGRDVGSVAAVGAERARNPLPTRDTAAPAAAERGAVVHREPTASALPDVTAATPPEGAVRPPSRPERTAESAAAAATRAGGSSSAPAPGPPPSGSDRPITASTSAAPAAAVSSLAFVSERVRVSEGASTARLVVRRTGGAGAPAPFVWWAVAGTAVPGEDYADLGRVAERFAADERDHAIYVPITADTVAEPVETFTVRVLGTGAEAQVAAAVLDATVTIVDDD